ncbi:hypothetical protein O7632_28860 [Solwaraspora sp. WMMD406]|uniref:hypothetical protein n=1 Tax=Solwaraspora sp. WMMD406 TaxID=3016095 RepID=UPI002416433B|nr:hypothetical protein [Solwaraspora sp. WMMD406]MDG4768071.1 hypothetical protein [Solwaraspora sp. WMMD406]
MTRDSAVPHPSDGPEAVDPHPAPTPPAGAPTGTSADALAGPRAGSVDPPSPWAATGPDATWWHGGTARPARAAGPRGHDRRTGIRVRQRREIETGPRPAAQPEVPEVAAEPTRTEAAAAIEDPTTHDVDSEHSTGSEHDVDSEHGADSEQDTEAMPHDEATRTLGNEVGNETEAAGGDAARDAATDVPEEPEPAPPVEATTPGRRPVRRSDATARRTVRTRSRRRKPRRPATGIAWILVLSAAAAFFGWVSAEPLWLATGRGTAGTATVTGCTGSGLGQRCLGEFVAHTGFTADQVRLLGVAPHQQTYGTELAARMLHPDRGTAYVVADLAMTHLRWAVGWTLVLLCGVGLVWGSGARRLATRSARHGATLAALAAPVVVAAGFLAASW